MVGSIPELGSEIHTVNFSGWSRKKGLVLKAGKINKDRQGAQWSKYRNYDNPDGDNKLNKSVYKKNHHVLFQLMYTIGDYYVLLQLGVKKQEK